MHNGRGRGLSQVRYDSCVNLITEFRNITGIPFDYVYEFIDDKPGAYRRLLDLFFKWGNARWTNGWMTVRPHVKKANFYVFDDPPKKSLTPSE